MLVPFVKMHGCGNDFVVFDERQGALGFTAARAAAVADRRTGIGCDQLITVEPPPPGIGAHAFMRIRNPDGSEAGACGNATRCVVDLLARQSGRAKQIIRTVAGNLPGEMLADGRVAVDMGPPRFDWREVPLAEAHDTLSIDFGLPIGPAAALSMGNPHATFFVPDLAAVAVAEFGPALETHPLFPDRANIGFAQLMSPEHIRLRVWERGAGLTLACGSGACAALVNAHRLGFAGPRAQVDVDGGSLEIEWREDGRVIMTGPVATAFSGMIDLDAYPA